MMSRAGDQVFTNELGREYFRSRPQSLRNDTLPSVGHSQIQVTRFKSPKQPTAATIFLPISAWALFWPLLGGNAGKTGGSSSSCVERSLALLSKYLSCITGFAEHLLCAKIETWHWRCQRWSLSLSCARLLQERWV